MALADIAPHAQTQDTRRDRGPWFALGVAVFNVVAYVLVLVVPYYAAGAPDPSAPQADGTWSYPSAIGPLMTPLVFWVLGVAPFAAAVVAGWSGLRLWFSRDVPRGRAPVWAALVVSVATFAWFVTEGAAIMVWFID